MSEPLKKVSTRMKGNAPHVGGIELEPYILASESVNMAFILNAAIDRINELEDKYESHRHGGHRPSPRNDYSSYTTKPITTDQLGPFRNGVQE